MWQVFTQLPRTPSNNWIPIQPVVICVAQIVSTSGNRSSKNCSDWELLRWQHNRAVEIVRASHYALQWSVFLTVGANKTPNCELEHNLFNSATLFTSALRHLVFNKWPSVLFLHSFMFHWFWSTGFGNYLSHVGAIHKWGPLFLWDF